MYVILTTVKNSYDKNTLVLIGNDTCVHYARLINEQHTCIFAPIFRKGDSKMPKTKAQNIIFTILMAFAMVYAMICYNIAINRGGMTNEVFLLAFHELVIMWPLAFILEFFAVEKLSHMLAFRIVTPKDRPIFILLAISSMIVCLMCPLMSLAATILFKNPGKDIVAVWFQTTAMNFPMALYWQIFFAGPLVRLVFRSLFKKQLENFVPQTEPEC